MTKKDLDRAKKVIQDREDLIKLCQEIFDTLDVNIDKRLLVIKTGGNFDWILQTWKTRWRKCAK